MRSLLVRAAALALLCALALAGAARAADTPFGGDPGQSINTTLGCAHGAPTGFEFPAFFYGSEGAPSCLWTWSNPAVGSDIVPFPASGGSGTITSVTLPAMPSPGPMSLVVLTAALNSTGDPGHPQSICCQVKQVGPSFTVPANQVTTVAQSLRVSATEEADLSKNGDTSFGDLVGVAVLSPSASLPIRYTGQASGTNFDGTYAYYPAPSGPDGEYREPYDPIGFQLLARFTLAIDGQGGGGGGGEGAAGGLELAKGTLRVGADGRTVTVGTAANPPTAATTQTLTAPRATRVAIRPPAQAARAVKPILYGTGRTKVASGKRATLKLRLNAKARSRLAKQHKLKATLSVEAANSSGQTEVVTRRLTIKPKRKKRKG